MRHFLGHESVSADLHGFERLPIEAVAHANRPASCGLPPGLERDNRRDLCQGPDCHCQRLLRGGQLVRAVNIVECTRLRYSFRHAGDTQGLLFHASVPLISQNRPLGLINIATEQWEFLTSADLQFLSAAGSLFEELTLTDETLSLESGDALVAYTDGLTDTVNDRDEPYGDSRLAGTINNAPAAAQDILTHILKDLEAFAGPVPRPDDVTLLILTAD